MSTWEDACDPVPARREEGGVLRADGAPPKAEKQKRSPAHCAALKAAALNRWAGIPLERRKELLQKSTRTRRKNRQLLGSEKVAASAVPTFAVDPDFDEMEG